eukprot:TRINITY_DN6519_c1_g4_i4.p1 TRINITY_DN6519_c1_g4~~TRINITY_DN6519_c1_g4_i4.p1  ORF type:complete len:411 (+),score=79.58 TRINITY_DN6519_c1_g4_i4:63-1235(+)
MEPENDGEESLSPIGSHLMNEAEEEVVNLREEEPNEDHPEATRFERFDTWVRSETGALVCVALSAVFYSIQSVLLKYCKQEGIPSVQVVFGRALLQGFAIFIHLTRKGDPLLGPAGLKRWVALRGFLGGSAFVLLFHAMSVLPIGDATTLLSLHPIVTVVVARVFMNEQIRPTIVVAAMASIGGSLLITRPGFIFGSIDDESEEDSGSGGMLESRTAGIISALLTSLISGFVLVIIRYTKKAGNAQQLWPWSVTASVVSLVLGVTVQPFTSPTVKGAVFSFLVIIFGCTGHWLMTHGARFSLSGPASLTRSTEIVYSYAWEVFLFHQRPPPLTIVGVLLIFGAIGIVGADKWAKQRSDRKSPKADTENNTEMHTIDPGDYQLHLCDIDSE